MDTRPCIVIVEAQWITCSGRGSGSLRGLVKRELPTLATLDVGLRVTMGSRWLGGCENDVGRPALPR